MSVDALAVFGKDVKRDSGSGSPPLFLRLLSTAPLPSPFLNLAWDRLWLG